MLKLPQKQHISIDRQEALELLNENIQSIKMLRHSYASEAVMCALAKRLGQDEDEWSLAGLLHDIDVELTQGDLEMHGLKARALLTGKLPEAAIDAIEMHNEMATGKLRSTLF